MSCLADDHEPLVIDGRTAAVIDNELGTCQVCEHCAALWDGERWVE